jgi:predicted nucleotidyltransferase
MERTISLPDEISKALTELKEGLTALYGERLKGIYLFGSYSRGDFTEGSDVDIVVLLAGEVKVGEEIDRIGVLASDISLRYGITLSVLPIPETWWASRKSPWLENLRREGIKL